MKTISVSQLKTHLSRELRKVGKGSSILVTDHDHPVAILSPVEKAIPDFIISYAKGSMSNFKLKNKVSVKTDPLDFILNDRER
jgi:antitoxin (DNA-binding transcriptional repressor) of toxin-antitoxin stability system